MLFTRVLWRLSHVPTTGLPSMAREWIVLYTHIAGSRRSGGWFCLLIWCFVALLHYFYVAFLINFEIFQRHFLYYGAKYLHMLFLHFIRVSNIKEVSWSENKLNWISLLWVVQIFICAFVSIILYIQTHRCFFALYFHGKLRKSYIAVPVGNQRAVTHNLHRSMKISTFLHRNVKYEFNLLCTYIQAQV